MSGHVHYDIDAMRAKFQAQIESTHAAAIKRIGGDDSALAFENAQHFMRPAGVEFLLCFARASNGGIQKLDALQAASIELGKMAGNLIASSENNAAVADLVMRGVFHGLRGQLDPTAEGIHNRGSVSVEPTPAGHA